MSIRSYSYATPLTPSNKMCHDRMYMEDENTCCININGKHTYLSLDVNNLPFTAMIENDYKEVLENGGSKTFYDIGEHDPNKHFTIDCNDILHFNYILLLFSLRQADARHMWKKSIPTYFASYIREDAFTSLLPHHLKIACLDALISIKDPLKEFKSLVRIFKSHGLPPETAKLYYIAYQSGNMLNVLKKIRSTGEKVVISMDSLIEESNSIIESTNLSSLANFAAGRKLLFISNSQRFDNSELAQELLNRARTVYMLSRPLLSIGHATNYARATIASYTQRIISHYTKEGNARLIDAGNGAYDNVVRGLDDSMHMPFSEDDFLDMIDARILLSKGLPVSQVALQLNL